MTKRRRPLFIIRVWVHPSVPDSRIVGTVGEVKAFIRANQHAHRVNVCTIGIRDHSLSERQLILAILNNRHDEWREDREPTIFDMRQPELGKLKSIDHELARQRMREPKP